MKYPAHVMFKFSQQLLSKTIQTSSTKPSHNSELHKSPVKWVAINGTAEAWEQMSGCLHGEAKLGHGRKKEEDNECVKRDKGNGCLGGRVCSPLLQVSEPDEPENKFTLLMSVGEGRGDHRHCFCLKLEIRDP